MTAKRKDKVKAIKGKEWKHSMNISLGKYTVISEAILKVLSPQPVRFAELVTQVKKEVKNFPGSVDWYMVGTLRQLEREGKVVRNRGNTVTYQKIR